MAADTNSQTYLLKILEIPGKSVTEKYIAVLKDKLEKRGLKYSINIVVDENIARNMQPITEQTGGGGDSTFPYNLFESKIDRILAKRMSEPNKEKGWLSNAYDKLKGYNQERQGIMDRLFSYTPIDKLADATELPTELPTEPPTEPPTELSTEPPAAINDILREDDVLISTAIDLPENYTGVLYIQLTIYDQSAGNTGLVYGIYELNNNIIV